MLHYKNTNELVMFHVFGVHLLWMYVMIFIIIGTQKFSFLLEVFSQFNESEHVFSIVVSNQKHVFLSRRCKDDLKHVPLTSEYAQYLTTVDTFKRGGKHLFEVVYIPISGRIIKPIQCIKDCCVCQTSLVKRSQVPWHQNI